MQQAKFSLSQSLVTFLANHKSYGFKDKSSMVRTALDHFRKELEIRSLKHSAELYSELYENDFELQELTDVAISGWPE